VRDQFPGARSRRAGQDLGEALLVDARAIQLSIQQTTEEPVAADRG